MKHVRVSKYHKQNEKYIVYLGNGTCHSFKQEVQTLRFLALTSKFLTKSLYDLRFIYCQVSAIYHRNWAYFMHNKAHMSHRLVADEMFCKETLRSIEDQFDLIINRCEYTNGNYFAFQKQTVIVRMCKDVVLKLDKLHKTKSNAVDRFEFDALYDRLKHAEDRLVNYSQTEAYQYFTLPIHIGDDHREFIPELQFTA